MSNKEELINLSYWIAVNLFGKHAFEPCPDKADICAYCSHHASFEEHEWPHYAIDPAASLEVLKKCAEKTSLSINKGTTGFWVGDLDKKNRYAIEQTLELAICKFSKALFEKGDK